MRRRKRFLVGLLSVLLAFVLLAGCEKQEEEDDSYTIYYVNATGTSLMESQYQPSAETFEELMEELLSQLETAPAGLVSALQDPVSVNGYERGIDALRIDFSKNYYELDNVEEVLLRAAVVKTFSQIPGVTKIMITVEQEQLHDAQGQPVPAMDAESFIDTKEGGINSYLYAKLSLYFPDSTGQGIVKEMRNLHYSSNMVLERVVLEQLVEGPKDSGLAPLFTKDVKIQNLYIKNEVCTVSFAEEANKIPAESQASPEQVLQAVVNSICVTCDGITGVRFEIDGDGTMMFRDAVDLNQVFTCTEPESQDLMEGEITGE